MGMSGQLRAFHFNPRESTLSPSVPTRIFGPQSRAGRLRQERSLLLCLGNEPGFMSLPFLSLSPYIDGKYKRADKIYTYLCNKPKIATRRNMFHRVLLRFTNMFRSLLPPSSRCHNRIKLYTKV